MNSLGVGLALNSSGALLCYTIKSKSYGVIECHTSPTEVAAASDISLFSYPNRNYTVCEGSDASLCLYEQQSSSSVMPAFTVIDNSVSN